MVSSQYASGDAGTVMRQASVWTKNAVLEREARELRDWQAWARLKFAELEYECATKEREMALIKKDLMYDV